jgi:dTDP-D-glucose 4,6-dehydratase
MTLDEFLRNEVKEICKKVKLTGFRNKKILILGSNSFFGSYLALVLNYANKFYNINCNITCVSKNNPNERLKNLRKEKKIKFIKKDITNKKGF